MRLRQKKEREFSQLPFLHTPKPYPLIVSVTHCPAVIYQHQQNYNKQRQQKRMKRGFPVFFFFYHINTPFGYIILQQLQHKYTKKGHSEKSGFSKATVKIRCGAQAPIAKSGYAAFSSRKARRGGNAAVSETGLCPV
jgi:hypothetical protein